MMKTLALDCVLVPLGLVTLAAYHGWLLRRVLRRPTKTIIGINTINRTLWVHAMMEDPMKSGVLAVQTLRNNIMASTLLASTAITLSSIIAVLMTSTVAGGVLSGIARETGNGDNGVGLPTKFFAILVCFLVAFLLNVQSVRYFSHASILVNVPGVRRRRAAEKYAALAMNRGSYFWSLGLRAFYFSFPLIFWLFGPVPMFCCSVCLVCLLFPLDVYSGWGAGHGDGDEEEDDVVGGDAIAAASDGSGRADF